MRPSLHVKQDEGRDVTDMEEVARTITAYDKDTGEYLGSVELPSTPWGNPITYLYEGKQHILVAVGGRPGDPAELIALALP